MATPLTLNTDRGVDGTPRVTAAGEIDISNIHVFTEALTTASEGSRRPITVDMSAVKYLDSAGINVLFKHADEIDRLHLIVHPFLMRVLTITGLSEIANVQPAPAPACQDSDGRDGASDGRL
jgi:anti-sigma B factor antagonist